MSTILAAALSTLTGSIIGFLINSISGYKKRDDVQTMALRNILKSNLVNQYYVYAELGSVPRYIKEAWYNMYESYIDLGGNSFVKHSIEPKFAMLKIKD